MVYPLKKPITRKTNSTWREKSRNKAIIVTLYPGTDGLSYIGLRLERNHQEEIIPVEAVMSVAIKMRVAKERAEKKERRKNKWIK